MALGWKATPVVRRKPAGLEKLGRKQMKEGAFCHVMSVFYSNKSWCRRHRHREGPGPGLTTIHGGETALERPNRHLSRWRCFHLAKLYLRTHLKILPCDSEKESQQERGQE